VLIFLIIFFAKNFTLLDQLVSEKICLAPMIDFMTKRLVSKQPASTNKKSNLHYTRLIPFQVSRVSGAHLRGFVPEPTHQGCNCGESLATCGRFDRLGIWTPYLPHQKQTLTICIIWPVPRIYYNKIKITADYIRNKWSSFKALKILHTILIVSWLSRVPRVPEIWSLNPGLNKSWQCKKRFATASTLTYKYLCYLGVMPRR